VRQHPATADPGPEPRRGIEVRGTRVPARDHPCLARYYSEREMSLPELTTVAEGDLPSGQHWILQAGGTREDFYRFLETVHPDGHRDQGGMAGPLLYPDHLLNTYSGGDDRGLLRLIVRADPRVARLRLTLTTGELVELAAVGTDLGLGVSYFAALLPRTTGLADLTPLDPAGHPIVP
jgi:hypothetical protein